MNYLAYLPIFIIVAIAIAIAIFFIVLTPIIELKVIILGFMIGLILLNISYLPVHISVETLSLLILYNVAYAIGSIILTIFVLCFFKF
jgi:hypothetical protein